MGINLKIPSDRKVANYQLEHANISNGTGVMTFGFVLCIASIITRPRVVVLVRFSNRFCSGQVAGLAAQVAGADLVGTCCPYYRQRVR